MTDVLTQFMGHNLKVIFDSGNDRTITIVGELTDVSPDELIMKTHLGHRGIPRKRIIRWMEIGID